MRAAAYILVEVQNSYNNFVTLDNGMKYQVNDSIDDVETLNRVGKVVDAPAGMKCNPGDMILFHHNICRKSWGPGGKLKRSAFQVRPGIFFVPVTEVFMIMPEGADDWQALDPFVFVKPLPLGDRLLPNGLPVPEEFYKNRKNLQGEIAYVNEELSEMGVEEGDRIIFQQDSEHEYKIRGELYYKMRTNDILALQ